MSSSGNSERRQDYQGKVGLCQQVSTKEDLQCLFIFLVPKWHVKIELQNQNVIIDSFCETY